MSRINGFFVFVVRLWISVSINFFGSQRSSCNTLIADRQEIINIPKKKFHFLMVIGLINWLEDHKSGKGGN